MESYSDSDRRRWSRNRHGDGSEAAADNFVLFLKKLRGETGSPGGVGDMGPHVPRHGAPARMLCPCRSRDRGAERRGEGQDDPGQAPRRSYAQEGPAEGDRGGGAEGPVQVEIQGGQESGLTLLLRADRQSVATAICY